MSNYRHLVIKTISPQIDDDAVQNTLSEYWRWAEESGISDMRFEIVYSDRPDLFSSAMEVFALFEYKQSLAEFKLCHMWTLPKTKLTAGLGDKVLYT